jgi:uncharacterized protein (TIGR04168 family)
VVETSEIALVGDLHSHWDEADVDYFNGSAYQAILVTGDLGSSGVRNGVKIARSLSRIERPLYVMLGNNDADEYARITAELTYQAGRRDLLSDTPYSPTPLARLATACGYSSHRLDIGKLRVTLLAARPFARGGNELSFAGALAEGFGIASLEQSTERLRELVDSAETEHLIFLGHNGPSGLGQEPTSAFGRDFHPEAGDWGDDDFEAAIVHARRRGRKVLAVVSGHMHSPTRAGQPREWSLTREGVLYVNAARVPRHVRHEDGARRHHVALTFTADAVSAREVWVAL